MSLIPPAPLVLSKIKYHIKDRYKDDPLLLPTLEKLGPYYEFKLTANFRSLENGTCNELEEIGDYIREEKIRWDCIDTALNMFTRMKNYLRSSMNSPGVLRLAICHQLEGSEPHVPWSDMFIDEFVINCKGLQDENGKEVSFAEETT